MAAGVLIYAGDVSPWIGRSLEGTEETAWDRVFTYARKLPEVQKIFICLREEKDYFNAQLPSELIPIKKAQWRLSDLAAALQQAGEGTDCLYYFWADSPFLDAGLSLQMLEQFDKWSADYCRAEAFPEGLCPEVLRPSITSRLVDLAKQIEAEQRLQSQGRINRSSLFTIIEKDINGFDIEAVIAPHDMRDWRLCFACDSKANHLLCSRFFMKAREGGRETRASDLIDLAREKPDLIRTLPAYFQLQIVAADPQQCKDSPYTSLVGDPRNLAGHMPLEDLRKITEEIIELSEEATLVISMWGEASLHPEIYSIIDTILQHEKLSLFIETSGLSWNLEAVKASLGRYGERLAFIISLDAWTKKGYEERRGPGFEEAINFVTSLLPHFPESIFVQFLRVKENEDELEDFWRAWTKETPNVIIQKFSRFAAYLPERKVVDHSPLIRHPCVHLRRELSILLDGTIPLCRDCVEPAAVTDFALGRLLQASPSNPRQEEQSRLPAYFQTGGAFIPGGLAKAWAAGAAIYAKHIATARKAHIEMEEAKTRGEVPLPLADFARHPDYPAPCRDCDEFYTWNG